jgi:hypothetical protein
MLEMWWLEGVIFFVSWESTQKHDNVQCDIPKFFNKRNLHNLNLPIDIQFEKK